MINCKECQHWKPTFRTIKDFQFGRCEEIYGGEHGVLKISRMKDDAWLAMVYAETAEHFGCILGEKK